MLEMISQPQQLRSITLGDKAGECLAELVGRKIPRLPLMVHDLDDCSEIVDVLRHAGASYRLRHSTL